MEKGRKIYYRDNHINSIIITTHFATNAHESLTNIRTRIDLIYYFIYKKIRAFIRAEICVHSWRKNTLHFLPRMHTNLSRT